MCKVLTVSRSGYYNWCNSKPVGRKRTDIDRLIRQLWLESRKRYGAPKIRAELARQGVKVSRQRVQRRMKVMGIRSQYRKKYRPATTQSDHNRGYSPNILNRQFTSDQLATKWVSDITYLKSRNGWIYLTMILDLADHKVVGWSVSPDLSDDNTVIAAYKEAVTRRKPKPGLIFHSDRGSQYASIDFRGLLKTNHVVQSMSRKGNCWDNAVAESFFKILKTELSVDSTGFSLSQWKSVLFEYIEIWYNRKRIHSSLGYFTPAEKESQLINVA